MTSLLERRRIEAEFARTILAELEKHVGRERAVAILRDAVVAMARAAGRDFARAQGERDLAGLARVLPLWQQDGALEIDFVASDSTRLEFNVTRCRYAEMYRELGLADLGAVLSCNRDGEFCAGYNPAIAFSRPRTLMEGASHCDFRYRLEAGAGEVAPDPRPDPPQDPQPD